MYQGWYHDGKFKSLACHYGNNTFLTLNDMEEGKARQVLRDHILQPARRVEADDILLSFSSSFLYAIQYAVYEIDMSDSMSFERYWFHITIIDTEQLPDDTFQSAVDLLRKYDLDDKEHPKLKHVYHEGEFLAQHSLDTGNETRDGGSEKACQITDDDLTNVMYEIAPQLWKPAYRVRLGSTISAFRSQWYLIPTTISSRDECNARALGQMFGGKWYLPMAAWALALKYRRAVDIKRIAEELLKGSDLAAHELSYKFTKANRDKAWSTLRELDEWKFVMRTLLLESGVYEGEIDSDE